MRHVLAMLILGCGSPALAHGPGAAVGPDDLWHHWTFDLWIVLPLILANAAYGLGLARLWGRAGVGRGITLGRASLYILGQTALMVALVSPLDALSETLFCAHMVQHALLIVAAPILLVMSRPGVALAFAFPERLRRGASRSASLRCLASGVAWLLRPMPATALHAVALWVWHAPSVFDAALASAGLHTAEHLSFFVTAMLFWQSLAFAARSAPTVPAGIAGSFATLLHGGFLSALITFAPRPLYPWYEMRTTLWGLDALTDQQLAGLLMGVPLALAYLVAGLVLAERLLRPLTAAHPAGAGR